MSIFYGYVLSILCVMSGALVAMQPSREQLERTIVGTILQAARDTRTVEALLKIEEADISSVQQEKGEEAVLYKAKLKGGDTLRARMVREKEIMCSREVVVPICRQKHSFFLPVDSKFFSVLESLYRKTEYKKVMHE